MAHDYGICKLCLREGTLLRSHLVPRAYYKLLRTPGADDPNPLTTFDSTTRTSQDQVAQHLLCEVSVPEIDIDKLVYFGASIFWRASVADWTIGRKPMQLIQLGPKYEEQFRQYLAGESGFPSSAAIWVAVVRSESPAPLINFPVGEIKGKHHQHSFHVFGLDYFLYVGGSLTDEVTRHCAVRTPERYMFFTDMSEVIDRKAAEVFNKATPTKKLRERAEKDGARF